MGRIGATLGYILWFGLGDLHVENILLGRDAAGTIRFGPIDVECAFDDIHLASQASLLPHQGRLEESAGMACIKRAAKGGAPLDVAALSQGLFESLEFFERHDAALCAEIFARDLSAMPVRLILRSTREYHLLMKNPSGGAESAPLEQAERVQMARGDVPYFFRTFSAREVLFYSEEGVAQPADVAPHRVAKATGLARLPVAHALAPRRHASSLRDLTALQIARYLDPGTPRFESVSGSVRVVFDGEDIVIEGPKGRRIGCRRRNPSPLDRPHGS